MIEISNLTKYFGKLCAVDSLVLNVKAGEIFGFLGQTEQEKRLLSIC